LNLTSFDSACDLWHCSIFGFVCLWHCSDFGFVFLWHCSDFGYACWLCLLAACSTVGVGSGYCLRQNIGLAMSAMAEQFVFPWPCLVSHTLKPTPKYVSNRSFAQALLDKVDVPLSEHLKPCLKGNTLSIKIFWGSLSISSSYLQQLPPW